MLWRRATLLKCIKFQHNPLLSLIRLGSMKVIERRSSIKAIARERRSNSQMNNARAINVKLPFSDYISFDSGESRDGGLVKIPTAGNGISRTIRGYSPPWISHLSSLPAAFPFLPRFSSPWLSSHYFNFLRHFSLWLFNRPLVATILRSGAPA